MLSSECRVIFKVCKLRRCLRNIIDMIVCSNNENHYLVLLLQDVASLWMNEVKYHLFFFLFLKGKLEFLFWTHGISLKWVLRRSEKSYKRSQLVWDRGMSFDSYSKLLFGKCWCDHELVFEIIFCTQVFGIRYRFSNFTCQSFRIFSNFVSLSSTT